MKFIVRIILSLTFLAGPVICIGQDSLLKEMAKDHFATFTYKTGNFSGSGWNHITKQVQSSRNVLIGEDHFTNEIPAFTRAVMNAGNFDNFIIELDPYSTEIIEHSIQNLSNKEREAFNNVNRKHFSFYALDPEYRLLTEAVKKGINLLGAEQITKFGDRVLLQELANVTENEKAREIYQEMMSLSDSHFEKFLNDPEHTLYFMTSNFKEQVKKLDTLSLTGKEEAIIKDMKISRSIYENNDHKKRIQLMKHILLNHLSDWYPDKNLFKYGAVHMPSGESLLSIYDVGNLVSNVSDARFSNSYHVAVVAKSGMKGAPFPNYPNSKIDISKGMLSHLSPFFSLVEGKEWHAFNLQPLRRAMASGKLSLQNVLLERVIKGYDTLVVIPQATAAGF